MHVSTFKSIDSFVKGSVSTVEGLLAELVDEAEKRVFAGIVEMVRDVAVEWGQRQPFVTEVHGHDGVKAGSVASEGGALRVEAAVAGTSAAVKVKASKAPAKVKAPAKPKAVK